MRIAVELCRNGARGLRLLPTKLSDCSIMFCFFNLHWSSLTVCNGAISFIAIFVADKTPSVNRTISENLWHHKTSGGKDGQAFRESLSVFALPSLLRLASSFLSITLAAKSGSSTAITDLNSAKKTEPMSPAPRQRRNRRSARERKDLSEGGSLAEEKDAAEVRAAAEEDEQEPELVSEEEIGHT
ncbi:hypothetical protein Bca101_067916 [Brassica carinata]